jgi:hypothetical protein
VAVHVHPNGSRFEDAVVFDLVGLHPSAQNGTHASEQFARRVRLGHVVVGPELETDHDIHLGVLGGQHDDRHR